MKTLIVFCALFAAVSLSAAEVTLSVSAEQQAGAEAAAKAWNAKQKLAHDAAQLAKPVQARTAYVDVTWQEYSALRFADVLNSWSVQKKQADDSVLIDKLKAADPVKRQAVVDVLK